MFGSNGKLPAVGLLVFACAAAIAYAALVVWSPMPLPSKAPRRMTSSEVKRTAVIVTVIVLVALLLLASLPTTSGRSGSGGLVSLFTLALIIALGTAGLAAERTLPEDLFPEVRRREFRRLFYVIAAALFLTVLTQLWGSVWSGFARQMGSALGETPPPDRNMISQFAAYNPLQLLLYFLIGAGLFEEFLFRLGIMTLVWALTRRWEWGLLASALLFGLYHISPINGLSQYNLQAPVITVVKSFGMGLANGLIYRYRGFTAAVLVHTLGNWLLVMILSATGT
jgi:membrane protease YdiL (CAAX protease family)